MTRLKFVQAALALIMTINSNAQSTISVSNLKCDSKSDPMGIEVKNPLLSWEITSNERDVQQSDYQILVSDSPEKLNNNMGNIWDSKVVKSDKSHLVEYVGSPLYSEIRYFWKVKIHDQKGNESGWSKAASWQMGLLNTKDWDKAAWISYENLPDSMRVVPGVHGFGDQLGNKAVKRSVVPQFRKEFKVENIC